MIDQTRMCSLVEANSKAKHDHELELDAVEKMHYALETLLFAIEEPTTNTVSGANKLFKSLKSKYPRLKDIEWPLAQASDYIHRGVTDLGDAIDVLDDVVEKMRNELDDLK